MHTRTSRHMTDLSKDTILFGKSVTYEFWPQPPRELLNCQTGQMETMDLCVTDEELCQNIIWIPAVKGTDIRRKADKAKETNS
jgi:hypothetical protein